MPHEIPPDEHYTAGEYVIWEYTVEKDGAAYPIDGATVSWYLLHRQGDDAAEAVLSDGDSDMSATIVDAANGRIDVEIGSDVTADLSGNYWQRVVVTDSAGRTQKWSGVFPIAEP